MHRTQRLTQRRAVGGFSVGAYTFSCASDCAETTCGIDQQNEGLGGTLPDVFHRLSCASKITFMCRLPWTSMES
jgi:hypothetical protein